MADAASTVQQLRERAKGLSGHARTCKKAPGDCTQCQAAMAWFASLPGRLLAQVLEDRPAPKRS